MVRVVLYLFLAIVLISLLRSVIGVVGKLFASLGDSSPSPGQAPASKTGELKRDPVCGTYIPAETAVKRTVGGQVLHFCSEACSEKYLSGKV